MPNPALDTDPNLLSSHHESDKTKQTPLTAAPPGWGRSASSLGITHRAAILRNTSSQATMTSGSILESLHRECANHREKLEAAQNCACFYCQTVFPFTEITEWIDQGETTALCPNCGIDSVIPSPSGSPISNEILASMHAYWFERSIKISSMRPGWFKFRVWLERYLRRIAWLFHRST